LVVSRKREILKDGRLSTLHDLPEEQPSTVAALSGRLPFADASFDFVLSQSGVPQYLPEDPEIICKSFLEMLRVLRNKGKIFLSFWRRSKNKLVEEELHSLEKQGFKVEIEKKKVPVGIINYRVMIQK